MNKMILGLGTSAFALALFAIPASSVLAYKSDPAVTGPNYSVERHTAMLEAFKNKDYAAWKNLMQNRGKVTQVVTEANFAKFVEAHDLALQGKTAEAQEIRQELGLGLKNGSKANGSCMGSGSGLNR